MSANDYILVVSNFGFPYICKKNKIKSLLSADRRMVNDNEILGLFENYLKRTCINNKTKTIEIADSDENKIFSVRIEGPLLDDVMSEIKESEVKL